MAPNPDQKKTGFWNTLLEPLHDNQQMARSLRKAADEYDFINSQTNQVLALGVPEWTNRFNRLLKKSEVSAISVHILQNALVTWSRGPSEGTRRERSIDLAKFSQSFRAFEAVQRQLLDIFVVYWSGSTQKVHRVSIDHVRSPQYLPFLNLFLAYCRDNGKVSLDIPEFNPESSPDEQLRAIATFLLTRCLSYIQSADYKAMQQQFGGTPPPGITRIGHNPDSGGVAPASGVAPTTRTIAPVDSGSQPGRFNYT